MFITIIRGKIEKQWLWTYHFHSTVISPYLNTAFFKEVTVLLKGRYQNMSSKICQWIQPKYCQALSCSLYFNLSLSLRDRADTKTTFHHHRKLLRIFELTYTQVWYIFGIISSSPSYFCTENVGLIVVTIPFTKRCRNKSVYYERIDSSIWWYTDLSPHPLC